MEGGMGIRGNLLDPGAQEFYPATQFALPHPQIYYTYPPTAAVSVYHQPPPPLPPPPPPQYVSPVQVAGDGEGTRAVVLSMVPRHVAEGTVMAEMEAFGGVRAVEMGALAGEGIVTVHFYDLRSAQAAVVEVREQHVRQQSRLGQQYGLVAGNWPLLMHHQMGGRGLIAGQAVWAHFAAKGLDGPNQGSLVLFNPDPAISSTVLGEIFGAFGTVKEVRETTSKPQYKFVEFFDIRDAARALSELNDKEIFGRRLVMEFSRPSCHHARSHSGSSSSYNRRNSNSESLPLPPRLVRSNSRWSSHGRGGGGGGHSHSSSSSSGSIGGGGGGGGGNGEGGGGEGLMLLRRSNSKNHITKNSNTNNDRSGRRNKSSSINYPSSSASSSSSKPQQQQSSRRGWKNHLRNSGEARFFFKEEPMVESSSISRDSRTTVMIKNIPNKYSQKLLLNMLDNHCIHCNEQIADGEEEEPLSSYDFVYLPIDFNNKCNVGYGFVNLTSPEAAWRLYKSFHMQPWEVFNSRKICQVTYARLQGLEALKEHFKNSKFACDTDEYMPVVFSPPRDGKELTDPVPIGGRGAVISKRDMDTIGIATPDGGGATSTTASTHAPSDQADGADDNCTGDDEEEGGGGDETTSRLSEALLHLAYNQD